MYELNFTGYPVDPYTRKPETTTIRIAREHHGRDPQDLSQAEKIKALHAASKFGIEIFVDTVIALLPPELRDAASVHWDAQCSA